MKKQTAFVKVYTRLAARHGYSTAVSTRYDAWGGLRDNHGQHTMILETYE